jgi:MoaA/NifB/PqqE/SkfB family radical SAM enzyme
MCGIWRLDKTESNIFSELSTERILELLEELKKMGTEHIHLSGGECTLRKDFLEILTYASQLGFAISFNTNGTTMSKSLAKKIVQTRVNLIIFSVDSPIPEVHNEIRGASVAWEKAVRGIKNLNDARNKSQKKPRIMINCVVIKNNYRHLHNIMDLRQKVEFEELRFIPPISYSEIHLIQKKKLVSNDSKIMMDYSDIMYFNEVISPKIREKALFYNFKQNINELMYPFGETEEQFKKYIEKKPTKKFYENNQCFIPYFNAEILPSGDVVPCCTSPLFEDGYSMGNVRNIQFAGIWNNDVFTDFRKKSKRPSFFMCQECPSNYLNINKTMMQAYRLLGPLNLLIE